MAARRGGGGQLIAAGPELVAADLASERERVRACLAHERDAPGHRNQAGAAQLLVVLLRLFGAAALHLTAAGLTLERERDGRRRVERVSDFQPDRPPAVLVALVLPGWLDAATAHLATCDRHPVQGDTQPRSLGIPLVTDSAITWELEAA